MSLVVEIAMGSVNNGVFEKVAHFCTNKTSLRRSS